MLRRIAGVISGRIQGREANSFCPVFCSQEKQQNETWGGSRKEMFLLVTGGSGSGKSEYAESRVLKFGDEKRYYVATMMCFDEESRKRVERHRRMRSGKGFITIERFLNLKDLELPGGENEEQKEEKPKNGKSTVLLECMSNLAANEQFDPAGSHQNAAGEIKTGIDRLLRKCDNLVVVTNEIFSDGIEYDQETRKYQKILGEINCYMAELADEVVEVIYGIPCVWKSNK